MNIVVAQISEDEGLSIHYVYPEGEPSLRSGEARLIGRAKLDLQAARARHQVELIGAVTAVVGFECDRCLASLSLPVEQSFDLLYVPPLSTQDERELGAGDLSIGFYQGDIIDADDLVREQIELALPMARLCSPQCRGLCPECGANLNERECGCTVEDVDDRWSALKDIKSRTS